MTHPLVEQLRFARSEWRRDLRIHLTATATANAKVAWLVLS